MFGINILIWIFSIGIVLAFVFFKLYKNESYSGSMQWIILILNMICSLIWLSTAAGAIVDLIEVYIGLMKFSSAVLEINPVILGASIMAIGNSLGDLYNNSSLSSLGLAVMACTGTISGQLFNLLIGLGINLTRQTWRASKQGKVSKV